MSSSDCNTETPVNEIDEQDQKTESKAEIVDSIPITSEVATHGRQLKCELYRANPNLPMHEPIHLIFIVDVANEIRIDAPEFAEIRGIYNYVLDNFLKSGDYVSFVYYPYPDWSRKVEGTLWHSVITDDRNNLNDKKAALRENRFEGTWNWYRPNFDSMKAVFDQSLSDEATLILTMSNAGNCNLLGDFYDTKKPSDTEFNEMLDVFTGGKTDRGVFTYNYKWINKNGIVEKECQMCIHYLMNLKSFEAGNPDIPRDRGDPPLAIELQNKTEETIIRSDKTEVYLEVKKIGYDWVKVDDIKYHWSSDGLIRWKEGSDSSSSVKWIYKKDGIYHPKVLVTGNYKGKELSIYAETEIEVKPEKGEPILPPKNGGKDSKPKPWWIILFLFLIAIILFLLRFYDLIPVLPRHRALQLVMNNSIHKSMMLRGGKILITGGQYTGKSEYDYDVDAARLTSGSFSNSAEVLATIKRSFISVYLFKNREMPDFQMIIDDTPCDQYRLLSFLDYILRPEITKQISFHMTDDGKVNYQEIEMKYSLPLMGERSEE